MVIDCIVTGVLEVRELAPGLMPGQLRPGQLAQMLPPEQLAQMLPPGQLALGRWGIWEPTDEAPLLSDYSRLDLVVVPGVAFSSDGKRLGRGKSFTV